MIPDPLVLEPDHQRSKGLDMDDQDRLAYHAPELQRHGTVQELTAASGSTLDFNDNNYAGDVGDSTPGLS
jgi:hypothetical protein